MDEELDAYPDIETVYTKITRVENVGNENLTQFVDSNGTMTWTGRKLRMNLQNYVDLKFSQQVFTISSPFQVGIFSGAESSSTALGAPR